MSKKAKKYRARFHLGSGPHFKHWQIINVETGYTFYYNPHEWNLSLYGCKLVNRPTAARKVLESGVRSVAGWIECDNFIAYSRPDYNVSELCEVVYDPKVMAHWHMANSDECIDKQTFPLLVTEGRRVYVMEEEPVYV